MPGKMADFAHLQQVQAEVASGSTKSQNPGGLSEILNGVSATGGFPMGKDFAFFAITLTALLRKLSLRNFIGS